MSGRRTHVGSGAAAVYAGLHRMSERAESAALASGFDQKLIELLKLRTSQINGCAYCLELHSRDALAGGENPARLAVVSSWRETTWFTAEEEAALELAEWVTNVSDGPIPDEDYQRLVGVLGEEKLSTAFWVSTVMNSYNRVAITSHVHVGP